jgi:hypothetical protein
MNEKKKKLTMDMNDHDPLEEMEKAGLGEACHRGAVREVKKGV